MRPRKLSEVASAIGGELVGPDAEVLSVSIDSRTAEPATLFFALAGDHGDGHDYVADALSHGAAGAVVTHRDATVGSAILVEDVQVALQALAADERRSSDAKVVGITGSTGKTTTKDLLSAVLRTRFDVVASPGSFNNEIGLPLTLLAATPKTEVIVAEMGARGVGHIAELCVIARPDVGVVTNVGVAHMELFGTLATIARAKGELIASLGAEGVGVINADDPLVREFGELTDARIISFGTGGAADVRSENVALTSEGFARFDLLVEGDRAQVVLAIPGEHMVSNALAAAAAGVALGVPLAGIAGALTDATGSAWRMEIFETPSRVRVVNDAYNANPTSMAAAIKAAQWMAKDGRLCAVLGTMRELGHVSLEEHERIGELAARVGIDRLIVVGEEARPIAAAAVREGVEPENVASYDDPQDALADVRAWAVPGDVVLFKGSRAVGLEQLAEAMRA